MIKKLTAIGDSMGLVIEEPILRVRQATERLMAHHDETLRKLAK